MNQEHIPDYRLYHLHELEAALKNIDKTNRPKEANLIREFIQAGGYKYPAHSTVRLDEKPGEEAKASRIETETVTFAVVRQVAFSSRPYIVALAFVVGSFLLLNVIGWLVSREAASLVPIAFQASILCMVFIKHKYTRMLIKIWSGFLIMGGVAGLLSMLFSENFRPGALVWNVVLLGVGLTFMLLANRCVLLILYGEPVSLAGGATTPNERH